MGREAAAVRARAVSSGVTDQRFGARLLHFVQFGKLGVFGKAARAIPNRVPRFFGQQGLQQMCRLFPRHHPDFAELVFGLGAHQGQAVYLGQLRVDPARP